MSALVTESVESRGHLILVTGPTRSGKSDWAEKLATQSQNPILYIATAQVNPEDAEWQARIQAHRDRRPPHWLLQEVPEDLATALTQAPPQHCILVDSLGTWLANTLEQPELQWQNTQTELLKAIGNRLNPIIFVAEEVGWSVVSPYPAGRLFCDRLGTLVRQIGMICDQVYLVVAGYAIDIKKLGHSVASEHEPNVNQLLNSAHAQIKQVRI